MTPSAPLRLRGPEEAWRHRAHDVGHVLQRWRAVARVAGLEWRVIYETGGYPVYFLRSGRAGERPLYFSAGVHGDEAGAVLGLLEWAERSGAYLRRADLILIPLFNPVGLAMNTRGDAEGADLNRLFDCARHPHIAAWRQALAGCAPRAAVCLHEDYDAQGLYGYELNRDRNLHLAEQCLAQAEGIVPRDPRRRIEGRAAQRGVIRRRRLPMAEHLPEAVALYEAGTDCALTFETPSEGCLQARSRAQSCLLDAVCAWDQAGGSRIVKISQDDLVSRGDSRKD